MNCPPVIFLVFNRPDLTERVFESIREQRPSRLFVVADGPRESNPDDERMCGEVRNIVSTIDWPCNVTFDFAEKNLGCALRVASGITNAFEVFEEAIILEDDCLPDKTFYQHCANALDHYRESEDVVCVTGDNFQAGTRRGDGSFYFSKYPHCWGWATWRRAWNQFDLAMKSWPKWRDSLEAEALLNNFEERSFWTSLFDRCFKHEIDTWDFPWTFACWQMKGKTVTPNANLVINIGFDKRGTHTHEETRIVQSLGSLREFCIPSSSQIDEDADLFTYDHHFGGLQRKRNLRKSKLSRVRSSIRRLASVTQITERIAKRLATSRGGSALLTPAERTRILAMPRYTEGETSLFGLKTKFVDGASFVSAYDAIFCKQIYQFTSKARAPIILDCGANIGLSVLFFALTYPESSIIAFEPDPKIFTTLEANIQSWSVMNVTLKNAAVWNSEEVLEFKSDGADGGKIAVHATCADTVNVRAEPLAQYLSQPVEFLKIDIEGAETKVLQSVQGLLARTNKLFVEYHSFPGEPQTLAYLLLVLTNAGFRYSIHTEHAFPKPFSAQPNSCGMDLGLNIFCWRERWIDDTV